MADPKIPDPRYYPARFMEIHGPKEWGQLRFLDACRRLGIPEEKWPKFPAERLKPWPPKELEMAMPPEKYTMSLPRFNFIGETIGEWRQRVETEFRALCDRYIQVSQDAIQSLENQGVIVKLDAVRDKNSPRDLRYEWAAKRHCLSQQFKEMASDQHSSDKIRKAVYKVFDETGIPYKMSSII